MGLIFLSNSNNSNRGGIYLVDLVVDIFYICVVVNYVFLLLKWFSSGWYVVGLGFLSLREL